MYQFNSIREGGQFLRNDRPVGYVSFERQDDGRWRSSQLLPDVEFTVTVEAEGYEPKLEKLKLPEGAVKELEVCLIRLERAKDIHGQAVDAQGRPPAGK